MKTLSLFLFLALPFSLLKAQDDTTNLVDQEQMAQRVNELDKIGYFPPSFKKAIHTLIDTQIATQKAQDEASTLSDKIPSLEKQVTDAQAQLDALQKKWDSLSTTQEVQFSQIKSKLNDPKTSADDLVPLLQAFIWSYPNSSHLPEIQASLAQANQKIAQESEADKQATIERIAARQKLLERVATKDLTLDEWQRFLDNMSQFELINYIGHPDEKGSDYWIYKGNWTVDPTTNLKSGLRIQFNGGRVLSVSPLLPLP